VIEAGLALSARIVTATGAPALAGLLADAVRFPPLGALCRERACRVEADIDLEDDLSDVRDTGPAPRRCGPADVWLWPGDVTELEVDAIVNAAGNQGWADE